MIRLDAGVNHSHHHLPLIFQGVVGRSGRRQIDIHARPGKGSGPPLCLRPIVGAVLAVGQVSRHGGIHVLSSRHQAELAVI